MPKGQKRKRDDMEPEPAPPRRSERQRKRTSYGEDFVEVWSPPRGGNGAGGPQPSTSSGGAVPENEPEPHANSVTWPSNPKYYAKELPTNHRKRSYFSLKRLYWLCQR